MQNNRKKRFSRIYIEITNVCNMSCSFCIGNERPKHIMPAETFETIVQSIATYTDYIYLHILGEPLLHPQLAEILEIAYRYNLKVSITTNGTLLESQKHILLQAKSLRKISISLHSLETKDAEANCLYLKKVSVFVLQAIEFGVLCELRMWNLGVDEISNVNTCQVLFQYLGVQKQEQQQLLADIREKGSVTLKPRLYLGKAERFQWPSLNVDPMEKQDIYCHGLRSQLGILCDGTVVPCCLDSNGDIHLGNILEQSLDEILESPRSKAMYHGFSNRRPTEELCKRCGYATRF